MEAGSSARWYLLIHQLPPKPLYLRAKVRALLARSGAIALKDSAYLAPDRPELLPVLRRIAAFAVEGGGSASLGRIEFLEGPSAESLADAFRRERDVQYAELVAKAAGWRKEFDGQGEPAALEGRLRFRL